jgi:hypothetical protein
MEGGSQGDSLHDGGHLRGRESRPIAVLVERSYWQIGRCSRTARRECQQRFGCQPVQVGSGLNRAAM